MKRSRRVTSVAVLGFVLLGLVTVGATSGASGGPQTGLGDGGPMQSDVEYDAVSMEIDLAPDGDARWSITYRIELDDENTTDAFESVQRDIRRNASTYVSRFRDRMVRTANTAENATGRTMAVENVTVEATTESFPQGRYGVVSYRFAWTNFAVGGGETVTAGDAIEELFLEDGTSLTVLAPEGYRLQSSTPPADDPPEPVTEVTWHGRQDFGSDEPSAVFVADDGGDGGGNGDGDAAGTGSGTAMQLVLLAVVALLLATGAWLFARRSGTTTPLGSGASDGEAEPPDDPAGDDGGGESGGEPPEELLSNEERVLRLLEDHGGRMKQQQVAEELDWTAAKTSQVVGDLREDDMLDSFRLGRENVLTLPEISVEPEGSDGTGPNT